MTQPETLGLTADDVRTYYIGSVLSGGNDWPAGKLSSPDGWLAVADALSRTGPTLIVVVESDDPETPAAPFPVSGPAAVGTAVPPRPEEVR